MEMDPIDLDEIVARLVAAPDAPGRAREIAHLAFMEWLGSLPGGASFPLAALQAFERTRRVAPRSRAARLFRELLVEASIVPPRPLGLALPRPSRRGGPRTRRQTH